MANVHPCQVECTLMAFPQTANVEDLISPNGAAGKGNYGMVKANLLSAR